MSQPLIQSGMNLRFEYSPESFMLSLIHISARNAGAHLLLFGHTHRPCCFQEPDGLWVLNPGSARNTFGLVLPEGEALSCSLLDMP